MLFGLGMACPSSRSTSEFSHVVVEGLSECKVVLHLHFPLESVLLGFSVTPIAVTYTCRCTAMSMFPLFATSPSSLAPQGSFICRICHEHEPWGSRPARDRRDGEATMAELRLHAASPGHVQKMQVGVLMLVEPRIGKAKFASTWIYTYSVVLPSLTYFMSHTQSLLLPIDSRAFTQCHPSRGQLRF